MIKIGVFGLSGATIGLAREIRQKTEGVELLFFTPARQPGASPEESGFFSFPDATGLILHSDRLVFADPSSADMPFIRQALRQSVPLYFLNTARLTHDDMHEIVRLSAEAETPAICFNPVWEAFVGGKIRTTVTVPFYAEMVYRLPPAQFTAADAVDHLLYSLEAILMIFRAFPKRPVVNTYAVSPGRTDMIQVRLDFDNSALALFKYEGLSQTREHFCRLLQRGGITTCDFITGEICHSKPNHTGMTDTGSTPLPPSGQSLYRSWKMFLSGEKENNISMEERLATTRTHRYIRDKVHYNSLIPPQILNPKSALEKF